MCSLRNWVLIGSLGGSFKVPLEEQLDAEQLESLKKYQERKQQRQNHSYTHTQVTPVL